MNELADYLTNSVSSRRGTLVVGQRIVSAHQPFHTENTNHATYLLNHVQCVCIHMSYRRASLVRKMCHILFVKRLVEMGAAAAKLISPARLSSSLHV